MRILPIVGIQANRVGQMVGRSREARVMRWMSMKFFFVLDS